MCFLLVAQIIGYAQSDLMVTTVATFYGTNGNSPMGELTLAKDGTLYGTTTAGGAFDLGTVFKISSDGALTTLISFDATNGSIPSFAPVLTPDGNVFGATSSSIFQLTSNGSIRTLAVLSGTNGSNPTSLILGQDGSLYGTTLNGGAYTNILDFGLVGYGTVFKVATNGAFTLLTSFDGTNGQRPRCIVQASDGILYGTTELGGTNGLGTVFKLTTNGTLTSLFSFADTNGSHPDKIMQASDGFIYGMTFYGGSGAGTIFRMNTNSDFVSVFSFNGSNGSWPHGKLNEISNGVFYGTTYQGGLNNNGTIFRFSTNGTLVTLLSFDLGRGSHTSNPLGGLTQGVDGNLYGICQYQFTGNGGVFCLRGREVPIVHPMIATNQVCLTWNGFGGCNYVVTYRTNLNEGDWTYITDVTPVANGIVSYSEQVETDSQRFYNVVLNLPAHWW